MPQVFDILKEDHRKVERLFGQYEQTGDPEVALQICNELTVHAMVEEELVYPILAVKVGQAYAQEARREHQEAKALVTQIETGVRNGDDVSSLVKELRQGIEHHVDEEENEIFPKMQETVPKTAESLGKDVIARKEILFNQLAEAREVGHPAASVGYASKPPTNA